MRTRLPTCRILVVPATVIALCVASLAVRAAGGGVAPGDPADPPIDCNAACSAKFQELMAACTRADGTVDQECAVRTKEEFDWTQCLSDCVANGGVVLPDPDPGVVGCQKTCYETYSIGLQGCIDAAGNLDAACVAAADVAFVTCVVACGQLPGFPDPGACAPGCTQAYVDGVAACEVNGGFNFACFKDKRSVYDACLQQCGISLLPIEDRCVRDCEAAFQSAIEQCKGDAGGNGILDPAAAECFLAAQSAYDDCLAACGVVIPGEIRCASDCDQALKVRLSSCAGDPACEKAALNDYTACLDACGLVVPPIPEPDPCASGCDIAYKQSLGACFDQETGVADAECLSDADASYLECLTACGIVLPDPPANPNPECTAACEIAYKEALNGCYRVQPDGAVADVDEDCLAAADAAFVACLEPCGGAPDPLAGDPGFAVGDCEAKCGTDILGALFDCAAHNDGAVDAECLVQVGKAFNECLSACKDQAADQVRAALARASNRSFLRGDTNQSGRLEITDAIGVLSFLFLGGAAPPCEDAADANDDGVINISDASAILGYLFLGWGPLPEPSVASGADPTTDALGCLGS